MPFTCYDDFQRAAEGGGHMSAGERRQRILELLCLRRQDTYGNLASEFGVSRETIRHDIVLLMCSYPIETIRGRYGGGVRVRADYQPYRKALNKKQVIPPLGWEKSAGRSILPPKPPPSKSGTRPLSSLPDGRPSWRIPARMENCKINLLSASGPMLRRKSRKSRRKSSRIF